MNTNSYWNDTGKFQQAANAIRELVPVVGSVTNPAKNKALEKFRKASNVYYDLYNNGLCNCARQFKIFGIGCASSVCDNRRGMYYEFSQLTLVEIEQAMDTIVAEAYQEQRLNLPTDCQNLIDIDD